MSPCIAAECVAFTMISSSTLMWKDPKFERWIFYKQRREAKQATGCSADPDLSSSEVTWKIPVLIGLHQLRKSDLLAAYFNLHSARKWVSWPFCMMLSCLLFPALQLPANFVFQIFHISIHIYIYIHDNDIYIYIDIDIVMLNLMSKAQQNLLCAWCAVELHLHSISDGRTTMESRSNSCCMSQFHTNTDNQ